MTLNPIYQGTAENKLAYIRESFIPSSMLLADHATHLCMAQERQTRVDRKLTTSKGGGKIQSTPGFHAHTLPLSFPPCQQLIWLSGSPGFAGKKTKSGSINL